MNPQIVTACVNVGRTLREFKPCTFDYYRENLRAFAALGWPLHAFVSDDAAGDLGTATGYRLNASDIDSEPWFADVMWHWSNPHWRTRHGWMSQFNAPELLLKHYSALTMLKVDMMARVAATLDPNETIAFIDCGEAVRSFKRESLAAIEGFVVPGRVSVHWTPYNWENRELNGMNWISMVSAMRMPVSPPMMHVLGGYIIGMAGEIAAFVDYYRDSRNRLIEIDLGTEQSILTAMAFEKPDTFNLVRFPAIREALS